MIDAALISRSVATLRAGGLIALPTETVYGLAADAENEIAVRRIFAAKGRPVDHPLIVHLADVQQIDAWASDIPSTARLVANAFWPGPLTIILPRSNKAAEAVTGGLATIGLRVPAHPVAQAVLREFGGGLAAPSANRFGRVSPTTAQHVREELGTAVDVILDGGPCAVGVESTILDLSSEEPCILRPGAITALQIEQAIGRALIDPANNTTRCAGRLESHYAPRAAVELVTARQLTARAAELVSQNKRVAVLCDAGIWEGEAPAEPKDLRTLGSAGASPSQIFGSAGASPSQVFGSAVPSLSQIIFIPLPADPIACAQRLYSALREADALQAEIALIVPPRMEGLGIAVADRLQKAAAINRVAP